MNEIILALHLGGYVLNIMKIRMHDLEKPHTQKINNCKLFLSFPKSYNSFFNEIYYPKVFLKNTKYELLVQIYFEVCDF